MLAGSSTQQPQAGIEPRPSAVGFGYLAHFWQVVSGEAFRLGNEKILSHLQKGEWLGMGHSCMAGIHCSLEIMGCMSIDKIFREVLFALLCLIRKKPRTKGLHRTALGKCKDLCIPETYF